jgi:AhpD family alkylhydroperoxidase
MTSTNPTTSTPRVPLQHSGTLARLMGWYARRSYGQELQPMQALLHHRRVTLAVARFEMRIARWDRLDPDLKELACLAAASQIGCSWCVDFGQHLAHTRGMAPQKLAEVVRWRDSEAFTPVERRVLEYAEAMTATPPTVTDEMVATLRADLDDAQLVELTEMISVENLRSRTNAALGLTSQGFAAHCGLPPSPRAA